MELIILWILFGIGCWAIAKNKNRDEATAFICGCLFGIFALVYYLVVGKKE